VIGVIVITDGRDAYLDRCVASLHQWVSGGIGEWWMHDDGGTPTYRQTLAARHTDWRHINAGPTRAGCAGAFQSFWRQLREQSRADHIFMIEGDFEFHRPIDLDAMAGLLDERPYLAEVALLRQPWNPAETAAGGVIEQHPDWYTDWSDEQGRAWLEQSSFFTANPCVFRRSLLGVPWPEHRDGCFSEGTFHQRLITDGTPEVPGPQVRYAYWGSRGSGVWVQHIGHARIGTGY
jgi:hypothetical protein